MKILWVKAGGLLPLDTGGKIRSYNILKELARNHEITFFTFYAKLAEDPHPQLKSSFAHVENYPLNIPSAKGLAEAMLYARSFFSPLPHSILRFSDRRVAHRLRRLMEEQHYDVVVCDFVSPGGVFPWGLPGVKVLFTHNVEAMIWERHYQVARNPLWKAVCKREYRKMERAERRYLERANLVLTVSGCDRDYFARFISPSKIEAIPTGVDVDYFRPADDSETPNRLVFSGSMDWMANEDGMVFFIGEILPRIRQAIPNVELQIVGRKPSPKLRDLAASVPGVMVTGRVDDIRPYVQAGAVYVVPLRVGGGTRLKIFEAMAMGKAIVSTSIGAEGLPVEHGKNILLADTPEEFASRVLALLGDAQARKEIGMEGRVLVESNYSWAAVAGKFETILAKAAQDRLSPSVNRA